MFEILLQKFNFVVYLKFLFHLQNWACNLHTFRKLWSFHLMRWRIWLILTPCNFYFAVVDGDRGDQGYKLQSDHSLRSQGRKDPGGTVWRSTCERQLILFTPSRLGSTWYVILRRYGCFSRTGIMSKFSNHCTVSHWLSCIFWRPFRQIYRRPCLGHQCVSDLPPRYLRISRHPLFFDIKSGRDPIGGIRSIITSTHYHIR